MIPAFSFIPENGGGAGIRFQERKGSTLVRDGSSAHAFPDQRQITEGMLMKLRFCGISTALAMLFAPTIAHAEPPKAAVFDFQLANLGAQGPTDADVARLGPLSDLLRSQLKETGRYEIVSTEPVKAEVAKGAELRNCGGCADDLARKLGADVAITGEIQKVSNLILNINVYVKDLKAGTPERAYSVDIRGDNDASFEHGVKYLVKNNLPPPSAGGDATRSIDK
jgi:hypothetical protein